MMDIDALVEAINYIYVTSEPKLYLNVLDELAPEQETETANV